MTRSERYLRAVASRSRHAKGHGEDLARAVIELEVVQLAKDVMTGGALRYSSATRLAEAILAAAGGPMRAVSKSVEDGRG